MSASFVIRAVEAQDHPQWLALRGALWPDGTPERHANEMRAFASPNEGCAAMVAVDDQGRVFGFVEASLRRTAEGCDTSPVGYIEGIYVDSARRRQGTGRALAAAAERWARERGAVEMGSDCHLDNDLSQRFHLGLGFEITERLIHFRRSLESGSVA